MARCMDGELQPIPDADLRVDARQLVLDRLLANPQPKSKLAVGPALRQQPHDLPLSIC